MKKSFEQERAQRPKRPLNIKEWLLADEPRSEDIVPKRGRWKSRPAIDFNAPDFDSGDATLTRKKGG